MIDGNLFQYDEYPQGIQQHQQQSINMDAAAVGDIKDFLTSDLKLSDTLFNDLFSEFDINTTEFQFLDNLTTTNVYPQQSTQVPAELPPSYDTILHPSVSSVVTQMPNARPMEPIIDEYLSSLSLNSIMELQSAQQPIVKYSSSPPPSVPVPQAMYPQPTPIPSTDMPQFQSDKPLGKQVTSTKRSRPSAPTHLPKLIKKPEPIPVTFDQFQALIRSASDTANSNTTTLSTILEHSTIIGNNIPLKIVNQNSSANSFNNMSSDENSHQDSPPSQHVTTANTNFGSNANTNGGRVRRKSSHNAIEKRYRSSINERILELKEMVADGDEKVQKSGVLRRTIDYIRQLQLTNQRLEEENTTLKSILKRLDLKNVDVSISSDAPSKEKPKFVKNPTTPPSSFSDSSESTLGSTDEAYSPVPKRQKRTSKHGMLNGTRLVLCCFMLCVLITNPFNYLLSLIHPSDYNDGTEIKTIVGSRTLQAATNAENISSSTFLSTSWQQLVAWLLNFAICLVCLVKLFVYGEPVLSEAEMQEYYVCKKKADQLMMENRLNEARTYYHKCCEKLYFSTDNTLWNHLSSITWQITRFCVNAVVVGRWLMFWSGWTRSIDTRDYNRELNDCLLQLWKIEYQFSSSSTLVLLDLFISTINTSMNAGKKLDIKKRNEIYLLAALTLRKLGGIFALFIPYMLKCLLLTDNNDLWLADIDHLSEFIFDKDYVLFNHNDFLESIRSQYCEFILYDNIQNQLSFQSDTQQPIVLKNLQELDHAVWWQHCLQVMRCISDGTQSIDNVTSSAELRQTDESKETIYRMARSMSLVDETFVLIIETIHSMLLVLHDDENLAETDRIALIEQLGRSSQLLTSMTESSTKIHHDSLDLAVRTLFLDGILSLRLRLLTNIMINGDQNVPYLNDFHKELDNYKQLNHMMKLPKQRIYLFESIFRVLSGINPLAAQTLFERALRDNSASQMKKSLSLDLVSALLLFCHFLPSTVYHYRHLLQQAAYESSVVHDNNDLSYLQQKCSSLIRQSYLAL